jgi:hypothetical protein
MSKVTLASGSFALGVAATLFALSGIGGQDLPGSLTLPAFWVKILPVRFIPRGSVPFTYVILRISCLKGHAAYGG